ncbi:MAG: thiol peroxidase [Thermaerobacter sp.]
MAEPVRTVNFRGQPMTLAGQEVRVGDRAPDFRVINNNLEPVTLADYRGKVKVLLSVPSLDTGVCDQETRRFNEEAAGLGEDVVVLAVSMDLPFAQRRWCAAAGVERVETLSDHREASFGRAYGVLMEDLRLLARAVFVVDRDDRVTYVEYVPEVASLPNFEAAVAAARQAAS